MLRDRGADQNSGTKDAGTEMPTFSKNQTRKGGHPASVCAYGRECTILLLQDDVDFIVKPVDNGEVEPAVAVEICGHHRTWLVHDYRGCCCRERSISVPEQDSYCVVVEVHDGKIKLAVAVEVAQNLRKGSVPHGDWRA